jgi:DHA1 family tetracycline resistance protein-like MFS transporter
MSEIARTARLDAQGATFRFIFAMALIDAISFGIVGGDTARASEWSATLGIIWGVMQLFCGPALGVLSDRIGRRPVLLISMFGLSADFFMMACAKDMFWLVLGRVLDAATAASTSTINAYVADVTEPDTRARAFGWIGAALSLGFIGGPVLGGLLGGVDLRLPFFVAGTLGALNALYGFAILRESLPRERRSLHFELRKFNPLAWLAFFDEYRSVRGLALLAFLFLSAWMVGPAILVLYTNVRYGWSTATIGLVMTLGGAMGALVQAALIGPVIARFGERGAVLIGAAAGAAGYAFFGAATTGVAYISAMPVFALMNLFMPALHGLMSRRVGQAGQGGLQGAIQAMTGLASIVGPLAFGLLLAWSVRGHAVLTVPGLAFYVAAAIMVVVAAVGWKVA